jgi:hypothetical protein
VSDEDDPRNLCSVCTRAGVYCDCDVCPECREYWRWCECERDLEQHDNSAPECAEEG